MGVCEMGQNEIESLIRRTLHSWTVYNCFSTLLLQTVCTLFLISSLLPLLPLCTMFSMFNFLLFRPEAVPPLIRDVNRETFNH